MPEKETTEWKKRSEDETKKILKIAKAEFKKSATAFSDSFKEAKDMLKFHHGIDQWSTEEQQKRADAQRPALTVNELPKFSNQVVGEMRKNKVQIRVCPAGDGAIKEDAETRAGMIKNIEYLSRADATYDHGSKILTIAGFGAARVLSRYTRENPFHQELYIENIPNPLSVHPDPDAKDVLLFSDGEFFFIDSARSKEEFSAEYGEDKIPGNISESDKAAGIEEEHWYDKDRVIAREYYKKEYTLKQMCQLSDGRVMEKEEAENYIAGLQKTFDAVKADQTRKRSEAAAKGEPFDEQPVDGSGVPTITDEREVEEPKVIWRLITAEDILDEKEWGGSGELIPVAFITGEYTNIAGKFYYNGMFRHAKDPQRMTNNAYTSLWESVSLAPKSPWQATAKMIEGYQNDYLAANQENFPILKYKFDEKFPGMKPERIQPANPPTALAQMYESCKNDIKDTIGMFDANLGKSELELSCKAFLARQVPGQTATYIYPDNRSAWIAHIGKIINDAIPGYYDTARDVRLRSESEQGSFAPINVTALQAAKMVKQNPDKYNGMDKKHLKKALKRNPGEPFHDMTKGQYDVVISTGPAYTTLRQEAAENLIRIAQFSGRMDRILLYFLISQMDYPGSKEMAAAIKKTLPPGLLPMEEGEEPPKPLPPSPQQQVVMSKLSVDREKLKLSMIQQQVNLVKLRKELSESKDGQAQTLLKMLDELFTPHHPADVPSDLQSQGGFQG